MFDFQRPHFFEFKLIGVVSEPVMIIDAHNLQAIAVGQIGIAAHDEIILVIFVTGGHTQVVAAADDDGIIGGEVGNDDFGMYQQIAPLSPEPFDE